jgi:hypothetical protein
MRLFSNRAKWLAPFVFVALLGMGFLSGCSTDNGSSPQMIIQDKSNLPENIQHAVDVQNRHTDELIGVNGIVGTGVGLENGTAVIYLFKGDEYAVKNYPTAIEDVPTHIEYSGSFKALVGFTGTYRNPIWSGVSIGNDNECAAGTLGCVVTKNGKKYILSNNHVLARENSASLGEKINQPGNYETYAATGICSHTTRIANLSQFVSINMKHNANNVVDCAIAEFNTTSTYTSQMALGTYTPSATTMTASVGETVKKTGRTTGLTQGAVNAINVTVTVQYSHGNAKFVNQLYITPGTFSAAGDSGSLIVDNDSNEPVGLLFAGSSSGTIANPINSVLSALGVTIVPN